METGFTIVQTVPLPRTAFPIEDNMNQIVRVAKVAF